MELFDIKERELMNIDKQLLSINSNLETIIKLLKFIIVDKKKWIENIYLKQNAEMVFIHLQLKQISVNINIVKDVVNANVLMDVCK